MGPINVLNLNNPTERYILYGSLEERSALLHLCLKIDFLFTLLLFFLNGNRILAFI